MPTKTRWVVRVCSIPSDNSAAGRSAARLLLEQLRYAGLASIHHEECFDLHAPAGITDTDLWARMNAERMSSFGFNAAAAPAWRPGQERP